MKMIKKQRTKEGMISFAKSHFEFRKFQKFNVRRSVESGNNKDLISQWERGVTAVLLVHVQNLPPESVKSASCKAQSIEHGQ